VEAPLSLNSSEKEPMTMIVTKAISCPHGMISFFI
jgi:hypothetical protein